ncbi:MAG: ATP-binding protein [Paracoccaceae bacterium]
MVMRSAEATIGRSATEPRGAPSTWTLAAALLLAAAALGGAAAAAGTPLAVPLAAFGVGGGSLAVVAALRMASPARRLSAPVRAFAALHERAEDPMALSDAGGALLAVNAALRARSPEAGRLGRIEALFEGDPAAIYRLAREASRNGVATGAACGRGGVPCGSITARRVDGGRLLWRLSPGSALGASEALEALGLPAVLREGDRLTANAAARERLPALSAALESAPPPLREPVEAVDEAAEEPSLRAALGLTEIEAPPVEEARRAAVPLPAAASGVSPGWLLAPRPAAFVSGAAVADGLERLPVALAGLDLSGRVLSINGPARRLLGPGATPGAPIEALAEGLGRSMTERVAEAALGRGAGRSEIARARREDVETFLQISLSRIDLDGEAGLIAVLGDATELKTLEAKFVQSQKMQAVGQLAGGVAHDFNNLLTAILGHCDLLLMRHHAADADHADLVQIRQNANRAAALVRQMLAFSRKQTLRPKVISLSDALDELSHLLNRLIGERVRLVLDLADDLGLVRVDQRQFEQVIVNLVVNARDAMPAGGDVRVSARNLTFEREIRRGQAVVPVGDYVVVEVADSGEGIPSDRLDKIFEPFFTTKRTGEGTGLGLSTAYGIVKQTGGFIFADSTPGAGAVFSIYLPRHAPEAEAAVAAEPASAAAVRSGAGAPQPGAGVRSVLLVEDEAAVRAFAARALTLRGFEVHEADCAETALERLEAEAGGVDAIVSDVVMPGLDGPTFVRQARALCPDAAVVFVSGYAEDVFRRTLESGERFVFLPKPYELKELVAAIEDAAAERDGALTAEAVAAD